MFKKMRKAQTMVEYIIIVALIAIAGIGVWSYFSKGVHKVTAKATMKLDEEAGNEAMSKANAINEDSIKKLGD